MKKSTVRYGTDIWVVLLLPIFEVVKFHYICYLDNTGKNTHAFRLFGKQIIILFLKLLHDVMASTALSFERLFLEFALPFDH